MLGEVESEEEVWERRRRRLARRAARQQQEMEKRLMADPAPREVDTLTPKPGCVDIPEQNTQLCAQNMKSCFWKRIELLYNLSPKRYIPLVSLSNTLLRLPCTPPDFDLCSHITSNLSQIFRKQRQFIMTISVSWHADRQPMVSSYSHSYHATTIIYSTVSCSSESRIH